MSSPLQVFFQQLPSSYLACLRTLPTSHTGWGDPDYEPAPSFYIHVAWCNRKCEGGCNFPENTARALRRRSCPAEPKLPCNTIIFSADISSKSACSNACTVQLLMCASCAPHSFVPSNIASRVVVSDHPSLSQSPQSSHRRASTRQAMDGPTPHAC